MNKYNNPRLLNTVVSGTGMKHPVQPHVVVGDESNGFIRGDLMDANAIVDLVNSGDAIDQDAIEQAVAEIIGTAPENLDTLGEVAEALTNLNAKLNKVYDTLMPLDFGDYLLSDLKTKIRRANITEDQKADVVGICIGQNPYTKKDIFVNVDGLTNSAAVKFYTSSKLPNGVFTTYASSEQTGTVGNNKINDEVLLNDTAKIAGKITATRDISVTSGNMIYQVNDFAGLHNTIEWAKQAKAGNGTIDQYPALQRTFGYSGITSFDDVDDNYDGWFLASTGYGVMMCPAINLSDETSKKNYDDLKFSVENLGKSWNDANFWSSSFCLQDADGSGVHLLGFYSYGRGWYDDSVDSGLRLFALIER